VGIQYRLTESDDLAARWAWFLHRPLKIILHYWYSTVLLCIVIATVAFHPEKWVVALLIALVVVVLSAGPNLLIMRWRWHRQFQKSRLADVQMSADISERGVTLSANGDQKIHLWAGFSQIYESRSVVMLEKGETDYLFLPKRVMSGAQIAELKRLADSVLNCKVNLSSPLG
jgi:hypothetical protein